MSEQDPTENMRRAMQVAVNALAPQGDEARAKLEAEYGQVWDRDQLEEDFFVLGFSAPFVVVQRKSDGKKGSLMFQHSPRFYFSWTEDR